MDWYSVLSCFLHLCPLDHYFFRRFTWFYFLTHMLYAKSLQLCPTLCDPMDGSPPGSSVHGILQARILEWVAMCFFRVYSWPRGRTHISCISCIGRGILYHCAPWEAHIHLLLSHLDSNSSLENYYNCKAFSFSIFYSILSTFYGYSIFSNLLQTSKNL